MQREAVYQGGATSPSYAAATVAPIRTMSGVISHLTALEEATARMEKYAEELCNRLSDVLRPTQEANMGGSGVSPQPACTLSCRIQSLEDRIRFVTERLRDTTERLEI
jgi:hypothetical protein